MSVETKKREIDGHTYSVTTFPAREGLQKKAKLIRVIAPALREAFGDLPDIKLGEVMSANVSPGALVQGIEALVQRLDESGIDSTIMGLLRYVKIDGKELSEDLFDLHFAGKYVTLYKVLLFVIEANNFFGSVGIGGLLERPLMPPVN